MKLSYLYGARASTVWQLLRENGVPLHPRWQEAASVLAMSLVNSWLHRREAHVDLSGVRVRRPIFILGHWRSGTTHLQYLLARDPQLASPNTYEVCFPNSLLRGEQTHGRLLARWLPPTRLQDRMDFGMAVPNEDEIALAALGVPSPYHFWAFPGREAEHLRHMSFRGASPEARRRFQSGLDGYLRRLTLKHGKTLLIKSPPHTARIALLLELYPDARFVHIARNPYAVFQSTRHLHRTWLANTVFLQLPDNRVDDRILSVYSHMYDVYSEEVRLVPAGQLHALHFEDLEREPLAELERLYDAIGLGVFPRRRFEAYIEAQAAYRKNDYDGLAEADRQSIHAAWKRHFEALGYPP